MAAPIEKTIRLNLDILSRVRLYCYGNFGKMFDTLLQDRAKFSRGTWLNMTKPMAEVRPEHHDEAIFWLRILHTEINQHREPEWHIPCFVPDEDFDEAFNRNPLIYFRVTNQGGFNDPEHSE